MDDTKPAPDVRGLSEAAYRRAKAEMLAKSERDLLRQRDASDIAAITAKHAKKDA